MLWRWRWRRVGSFTTHFAHSFHLSNHPSSANNKARSEAWDCYVNNLNYNNFARAQHNTESDWVSLCCGKAIAVAWNESRKEERAMENKTQMKWWVKRYRWQLKQGMWLCLKWFILPSWHSYVTSTFSIFINSFSCGETELSFVLLLLIP